MNLQQEIKKRQPFESPEQEACLNLVRTGDLLQLDFTRLFREHGLAPMRYLWQVRVERAARLLAELPEDALKVGEVGYRCGFTSAAHFSRTFKQRYGMSPRAYAAARHAACDTDSC